MDQTFLLKAVNGLCALAGSVQQAVPAAFFKEPRTTVSGRPALTLRGARKHEDRLLSCAALRALVAFPANLDDFTGEKRHNEMFSRSGERWSASGGSAGVFARPGLGGRYAPCRLISGRPKPIVG
jgi:hypothetical protein